MPVDEVNSRRSPAGCAWSSQPALWTRGTSPAPASAPRLESSQCASSYSRSPDGGPPASSGGAEGVEEGEGQRAWVLGGGEDSQTFLNRVTEVFSLVYHFM